jgi:hypothetical protein
LGGGALITSMGQKAGDRLSSSMGGQTRRIFVLHQKQRLAAGMGREMGDLIAFFAALRTHVDMVTSSLVMDSFFFFLSFFFISFLLFLLSPRCLFFSILRFS